MRKRKRLISVLGISFVIILSYLCFITIKNKANINAMNTLDININGSDLVLKGEEKYNSLNVGQLSATTANKLTISDIDNIDKIEVNDEEVDLKKEIDFYINNISKDEKIKISILYKGDSNIQIII